MIRSIIYAVLLALLAVASVHAQDFGDEPERPSLGSRLDQFRRALIGDGNTQVRPGPTPQRPGMSAADKGLGVQRSAAPRPQPQTRPAPQRSSPGMPTPPNVPKVAARPKANAPFVGESADDGIPHPPPAPNDADEEVTVPRVGSSPAARRPAPAAASNSSRTTVPKPAPKSAVAGPSKPGGSSRYETVDDATPLYEAQPSPDNTPTATPPAATASTPSAVTPRSSRRTQPSRIEPPSYGEPARIDDTPSVARSEKPAYVQPAPTGSEAKPIPSPGFASRTNAGPQVLMQRKSPSLSVETAGPRRISVGKAAPFVVSVRNSGDLPANEVVVFVAIPPWAEVAEARATSGTTTSVSDGPETGLQWRITSLAAQTQQDLNLKLIPRQSQSFDLAVRYTYTPVSSQATVEVEEAKLQMTISGATDVEFGQQQIYKLTISNPGTGDADDVVLHLIPVTPGDGGIASHRIGVLKAGASKSVEIELTARHSGRITIQAEATAEGDLRAQASTEVLVRRPGVQVSVIGPKVHYAGAPANFEVRVKNPGDATARHVSVKALLPTSVELLSAPGSERAAAGRNEATWTIEQLPPGAEQSFPLQCVMKAMGNSRVEAVATADGDLKDSCLLATQVMALADLVLEVTDTPGPVPVGQDMTYEVRIRNRGSSAADEVDVVAFFSQGFEPVAVEGGAHEIGSGTVAFKPLRSVPAGGQVVFKIKAKASVAGNHRVRVELQCRTLGTKLTQEDTTLFYGEDALPAAPANEPAGRESAPRPLPPPPGQ